MSMPAEPTHILTIACPDTMGIVAAVSRFLFETGCNIADSAQFGDRLNGRFFLRILFQSRRGAGLEQLRAEFAPIAERFSMDAAFYDASAKARTLILVSRFGHCLNDLLYRTRIRALPVEVPWVVSNHRDFERLVQAEGIGYAFIPVSPSTKPAAEAELIGLIEQEKIELIVLARYMQVLSPELTAYLKGRAINIHHSFLPGFKGARPYHQAYQHGVKLIGATAHYVTEDLDEGPIIEQAVERVHHAMTADDYVAVGRDVESIVLARAVKWHCEHRVLMNGRRTIVFT